MPHIQQLPSHVADLIAAGEVVERPASVVKELVENAIDAGATAVVVEISHGGMSLIRITDNGCGIAPGELPTAFLRHATSKLRGQSDLGKIRTLGFRGEALAAISAVSRLDIVTRQTGAAEGAALHLDGGLPGEVTAAGAPEGTAIQVRDLFYNTPARLKFMKKDSAETAAVNGLMQHLALSHPNISFKFVKEGVEALHTPGDGKLESTIYAALGRDFAKTLLPVSGCGGEITVDGFVTKPLSGRGSRAMQAFFVNGRFIKSQLLTAALEEGYRNQMMKGKFPGCVLAVTLPVTAVDVNVHPAKTVVKFAREHDVFDAVYHTVLDALDADGLPQKSAPRPAEETVNPRGDFFQAIDAKTYREQVVTPEQKSGYPAHSVWNTERSHLTVRMADVEKAVALYQTKREPDRTPVVRQLETPGRVATSSVSNGGNLPDESWKANGPPLLGVVQNDAAPVVSIPAAAPCAALPAIPAMKQTALDLPGQKTVGARRESPWRIAGEVLNTYVICEAEDDTIWLIDKHAAHERVNFDRLQASQTPPMRQQLLKPIAAELTHEDAALLLENLPLLEDLGFACEEFGGDTVLVREVPADIDAADMEATLEEMAEKLRTGRSPAEKREALLHTMACKAAIKAGMHSDERELRVLVDRVQSGEIKYCPHGRPVAVKLCKYELEKIFKRA